MPMLDMSNALVQATQEDNEPLTFSDAMLLAIAEELRTQNLLSLAKFYAQHPGVPGAGISRDKAAQLSAQYAQVAASRLPMTDPQKETP